MKLPPHRPRWTYLVNPALQGKWALGVAGAVLFSGVLLFGEYYVTFGRNAPGGPWDRELMWIFLRAHRLLLVQLAVFTAALAAVTVFYSHRVVGPLVNLRRCLRLLAEGDLAVRASFRRNDELHELAEAFNDMAETLQARDLQRRRDIKSLAKDPSFSESAREKLLRSLDRPDASKFDGPSS
jgi:methyl-accepting chemotaxis protein